MLLGVGQRHSLPFILLGAQRDQCFGESLGYSACTEITPSSFSTSESKHHAESWGADPATILPPSQELPLQHTESQLLQHCSPPSLPLCSNPLRARRTCPPRSTTWPERGLGARPSPQSSLARAALLRRGLLPVDHPTQLGTRRPRGETNGRPHLPSCTEGFRETNQRDEAQD